MGSGPRFGFRPEISLKTPAALGAFLLAAAGQWLFAQSQIPWTLEAGILFFITALWVLRRSPPPDLSQRPLPNEKILFFSILLLAAGVRLWRLDSFPTGLHTDQGSIGLFALRILHEGWRPGLGALQYQTPFPLEFYTLAGWFALVGGSLLTFRLYFIFLSLAALLIGYWFFRRLAGPRVALLSLFLSAIMRWDWTEARNGHSSAEAPLYLMAMLVLFWEGSLRRKTSLLMASALFAGLGLYAYQSLKALPLLFIALIIFEFIHSGPWDKKRAVPFAASLLFLTVLAAPLLWNLTTGQTLGKRESEVFIVNKILEQKNLSSLLISWRGTALMLNREGTNDPFHNLPGRRMLDDGTTVLLILGLGWIWRQRKIKAGAYPLLGMVFLSLPGLLAADPGPPHRFTGLMPLAAYAAAWGGIGLWDNFSPWIKNRRGLAAAAGLFLFLVASQNAWTYFVLQAGDPRCREAFGPEQNQIGETIEKLERKRPDGFYYFIPPFYYRNPTVDFIAYDSRTNMRDFDRGQIAAGQFPRDKPSVFFLEADQKGSMDWLKTIFPAGREEEMRDPSGLTPLYRYNVPPESLRAFKGWTRGLNGTYESVGRDGRPMTLTRVDPLINFSSLRDLSFTGEAPYQTRWNGKIILPQNGPYLFQVLTQDQAILNLDGRRVVLEKPLSLAKGLHSLRLEFKKEKGHYAALHLVWKRPGAENWEVIPASAFGVPGK